jgi:hypothetical protein
MKPSEMRWTVICEDSQHGNFTRHFLKALGVKRFYIEPAPPGKGSAAQSVVERYPKELRAYREVKNHQNVALIVMLDADAQTVKERKDSLNEVCTAEGLAPLRGDEQVVAVIPKRNIHTWLDFLRGEEVNESRDWKPVQGQLNKDLACKKEADKLKDTCSGTEADPRSFPESLRQACEEYRKRVLRIPA